MTILSHISNENCIWQTLRVILSNYAAQAKAEGHDDNAKALVSNLDEAADNLETMARIVFGPLDPDFNSPPSPPEPPSRDA